MKSRRCFPQDGSWPRSFVSRTCVCMAQIFQSASCLGQVSRGKRCQGKPCADLTSGRCTHHMSAQSLNQLQPHWILCDLEAAGTGGPPQVPRKQHQDLHLPLAAVRSHAEAVAALCAEDTWRFGSEVCCGLSGRRLCSSFHGRFLKFPVISGDSMYHADAYRQNEQLKPQARETRPETLPSHSYSSLKPTLRGGCRNALPLCTSTVGLRAAAV